MIRMAWWVGLVCALSLGASALGGPEEAAKRLAQVERDLLDVRADLRQALGERDADRLLNARQEAQELKPWVDRYRTVFLQHLPGYDGPVSLETLERAVAGARGEVTRWERDDADKGQREGPQTVAARAALRTAQERLAAFRADVLDRTVARQEALTVTGIRDFATLEARLAEALATIQTLRARSRDIDALIRRVESLERDRQRWADEAAGGAEWVLVDVVRYPRGDFDWSIPEDEVPAGGTWRKYSVTPEGIRDTRHFLHHKKFVEHWEFEITLHAPPASMRGGEDVVVRAKGQASWSAGPGIPEEHLSGQGVILDAKGHGLTRVDGTEKLRVHRLQPTAEREFRFRAPGSGTECRILVFTWNDPISVTWVYHRRRP